MMMATCTTESSNAKLASGVKMIEELYNLREENARLRDQSHFEEIRYGAALDARFDDALTIEALQAKIAEQDELIQSLMEQLEDQRMQMHELLCYHGGMMFH